LAGGLAVCLTGALLARRARGGAPLLAFFGLWGVTSAVAWAIATPIGGYWAPARGVVLPLLFLPAPPPGVPAPRPARARPLSRPQPAPPPLHLVPSLLDNRPAAARFWQPALAYLDTHAEPGYRVEVVPTAAHWEAYWIPRAGYPLARGWYRQLDMIDNTVLYS